jgi:hypothetical protein
MQRAITLQCRCGFGLSIALMCSLAAAVPACADVHVEGSLAAVRVTTSREAISDVLAAVAKMFNMNYRASIPLDAAADTNYSGSLEYVISHLLDGYSYVIKRDQGTTEIIVYGRRGTAAIPAAKPEAPKGIVSQWR